MGDFLTSDDEPELFDDKVPLLSLPADATYDNVPRARDLNRVKAALFDLRNDVRDGFARGRLDVLDVRDAGTGVGLGDETADTDAIVALFEEAAGQSVALTFPKAQAAGGYLLAEPIEFIGSPLYGTHIIGNVGVPARGLTATVIKYVGAVGDTMFHFRGLNGSVAEGICLNGNGRAECGLWISEFINADGTGLIGSANNLFTRCFLGNFRGISTADAVRIGLDQATQTNRQTSELYFTDCVVFGNETSPIRSCFNVLTGGNCKNLGLSNVLGAYVDYLWLQVAGSGVMSFDRVQAIAIGFNIDGSAIYVGNGANSVNIRDLQMENTTTIGATECRARAVSIQNGVDCTITGGYYRGVTPADDYAMFLAGPTTLTGFDFEGNDRAGSNVQKVQASGGHVSILNCYFGWNSSALTNAPVYDSGDNHLLEHENSKVARNDLLIVGCKQSQVGLTKNGTLPAASGKPIGCNFGGIFVHNNSAGITWFEDGDTYGVVIPYTAVQTAALTNTLTVGLARQLQRLGPNVTARVTANFTGTAGTVSIEVGHDGDIDAFLKSFVASAATPIKGVTADQGVALDGSTTNGTYMVPPATERSLQVKFTSSSGNLSGLSAGSVSVVFEHKLVGA